MKLLTLKQVAEALSCSPSYVSRLHKQDPTFPKPVILGTGDDNPRGLRWVESLLEEWVMSKTKEVEVSEHSGNSGEVHKGTREEVST